MSVNDTIEKTIATALRAHADSIAKVLTPAILGQLPDLWYETLLELDKNKMKPARAVTPIQHAPERMKTVTVLSQREKAEQAILSFLQIKRHGKMRDFVKVTGLTKGVVSNILMHMQNRQSVRIHRASQNTYYTLFSELAQATTP